MKKHKTENEQRNELLKFMDKNNYSANFLGKEIGCHPQTITNWVNGEKSMRIDTLELIHNFIEKSNSI